MSDRIARVLLAGVVAALLVAAARVDLSALSGGQFWGDGATYYSMAWSLAEDGDLRYETRDLLRVRREFAAGPQGLFLKRASGGLMIDREAGFPPIRRVTEKERRIYFAKPFTYPLAVAPFVRLFGTKGLLLANALALGLALVLGYGEARRRTSPPRALAVTLAVFLFTVAPVYVAWPTPELFYLGLAAAGLAAWSRGRWILSAVLLGIATYSKPYNLWLAIPLGLEPLLAREGAGPFLRRLAASALRGAVLAATTLALFTVNALVTGEWNYQGGRERKTFYDRFPGEIEIVGDKPREVTFGNSGIWMSTNELGPRVEGSDPTPAPRGSEPPRSAAEIRASFLWNLGYFWTGRFGGALPYFFPAVLAALLFLLAGPRDRPGWLALASLLVSFVFYIAMIPDNWYGGTGTLGNRYFLNLLPLAVFLVPRGREWLVAVGGAAAAGFFLTPLFASPVQHALHPGEHGTLARYRILPAELTMLNDLAVFADPWRKKQPVGDTEGDPQAHRAADPRAYYLYFLDDGTFGREEREGEAGFWLKGGARAEVVVRALEPVRRMAFRLTGGPAGDEVAITVGGRAVTMAMGPAEVREASLDPGAAFVYKDSFVHVLRLRSARGGGPRHAGAFVRIALEVGRRTK